MKTAPIFVVGTPRSGTTLTARILDMHPAIFMPGETHFMEDIHYRRDELGPPTGPAALARLRTLYGRYNEPPDQVRVDALWRDSDFLTRLCEGVTTYEALFERFMRLQAEAAGKRRWGNNVPRDLFEVAQILRLFPDARIIACVRDLRDFLVSYRENWRKSPPAEIDRMRQLYHPVITSLLWRSSMRQLEHLRGHLSAEQLLVLRYEDLVRAPEVQVRRLCQFVGESYDPAMLEVGNNSSWDVQERGIFAASVGRWRSALSSVEIWIAQRIGGRHLRANGYETEPVQAPLTALAGSLLATPWALARALRANREKRGPLVPYLARRCLALLGHSPSR
jgi:hypothetical protein